jgi:hypothetical protein
MMLGDGCISKEKSRQPFGIPAERDEISALDEIDMC